MTAKKPSADFIICVEQGYFEKQAKLLVSCIRLFGGSYANAPIYCYQPRRGFEVSRETVRYLENYGVFFNSERLNKDYATYKFANKPIICAYHEERSTADVLIYLDVDYATTLQRRPLQDLGPQRVEKQKQRLANARENADLYINTNSLSPEQIRRRVLSFLEEGFG